MAHALVRVVFALLRTQSFEKRRRSNECERVRHGGNALSGTTSIRGMSAPSWYHHTEDVEGRMLSILVATCVVLLVLTALWITIKLSLEDARRQGKSPLVVTAAVIFFFPWGPIAWLLFRPEPLNPSGGQREFRLDDYRVQ